MLQLRVSEKRIIEAFVFFRQNQIEPILIKGWAGAQNYPNPSERLFSDIDLIISPVDYDRALTILKSYQGGFPIDLHLGARRHDTLPFEILYKNSQIIKCGDGEVRILCPEDHLRVLCVHWLTDGGEYKSKLWDIYYAVENRPATFDWEKCLTVVSETRQKWIIYTICLAHIYLGLKIADTPAAGKLSDIPEWLIKTVEKEWASAERLVPLQQVLRDKKRLWKQIKKRLPPNPIQATVDMEGEFDNKTRIFYQIGDMYVRFKPILKRIVERF